MENLKGRDHFEDLFVDWILGQHVGKVRSGCIWLRVGISGGLLYTQ
jgi:hypothetical protein